MTQPTGTEAAVCALIAERQAKVISKYGTTVSDNPLELRQWVQHAIEEALDLAIYAQRIKEMLDDLIDDVDQEIELDRLQSVLVRQVPGDDTCNGVNP